MSDEPPRGPSPGGFPAQDVPENNREASAAELGNLLGVTTLGGGDVVVRLEEMEVYILRRNSLATQYIATQTVLEIFEEAVQRPGTWVYKQW